MIQAAQLVTKISTEGVEKSQAEIQGFSGIVDKAGGMLKTALVGAAVAGGVAIVGLGVAAVKMAGDFQSGMTSLVTGAGESEKNLKMVSDGILNLATQTGSTTKALTDGMYMIESAGYHGAAGLDVLKAAAMGAKVGNASLQDVANGVTTAMTDYAKKGLTAAQATNTLIATVAAGKTHMGDLANAMSTILPTAASVGVSFGDVSGAMATMTGQGTDAASASTYLRQMLMALENPAHKGAAALKSIGLTSAEVSDMMKKSLPDTLALITEHLKKKFPEGSAAYVKALADISGGSKQMQGMLELTGDHLKVFAGNVSGISDAVKKGGNDIAGWNNVTQDFNFKMDKARATVEVLGIKVGTALLPALSNLFDAITPIITSFTDWLTNTNAIQNAVTVMGNDLSVTTQFVNDHKDAINTTVIVLTTLFVPALIKSGVEAAIAGAKIAYEFVANIVKTGLEGLIAVGKLTVFIATMIASGVQAGIAGAKIAATFIASMVQAGVESMMVQGRVMAGFVASMIASGTEAVVNGAKIAGSFVASLITTSAQAIATGAVLTAQFVASLVKTAAQAVVTGATMLASLVPALISVIAEAVVAAVTAIPALVVGFIAWAGAAAAAAIATIAATWPILLIIAALALLGIAIYEVVTHWSQITAFLRDKWQAFTAWFMDKWNSIVTFFKALPGQALTWAADMIGQFVAGIENGIGAVGNAVSQVADKIKAFLHFSKPDIGPLTDVDTWMPDFTDTISNGLLAGIPKITAAMGQIAQPLNLSVRGSVGTPTGSSAIASNFAATVAASQPASTTQQTVILQVDGHQFGRVLMPHIADQMRYTLGVQGS